jgi:hypothetical protein
MHHKAKIAFSVVEQARDLKEFENMELKEIAEKLSVPYWTVVDWCLYRTRVYK